MFKTYDDGRRELSSSIANPSPYTWEYVICDSSAPWLLVTARVTDSDGDTWTRAMMLANSTQLQRLIEDHEVFLHRVQLVRPNCQKTLGWDIDDVLRIRAAMTEHDTDSVECAEKLIEYQFLGGEKCAYIGGKKSSVDGEGLKQVYSILGD